VPPSFEDLAEWAGEGRIVRADPAAIMSWRLPGTRRPRWSTPGFHSSARIIKFS
jgi:hypothetical protein